MRGASNEFKSGLFLIGNLSSCVAAPFPSRHEFIAHPLTLHCTFRYINDEKTGLFAPAPDGGTVHR
jgi:hypothetical protein